MGNWWQYAAPMFPKTKHHAAARIIQSVMRCALCYRWSQQAKQFAAAAVIGRACLASICRMRRRKHIERIVNQHMAKRALHSRMRSLRNSRTNSETSFHRKQPTLSLSSKKKIKVPVGFCVFVVSCDKMRARIGPDKDFVISLNPRKVRVLKLYSDISNLVEDDFTLCINGVPLLPNLFKKKLNTIGVCPGEVYNLSII